MAGLYQKQNGQAVPILGGVRNAVSIKFNNLISGLHSQNVQGAIDEVNTNLVALNNGQIKMLKLVCPSSINITSSARIQTININIPESYLEGKSISEHMIILISNGVNNSYDHSITLSSYTMTSNGECAIKVYGDVDSYTGVTFGVFIKLE